jgi:NAD(P)-dependent dehydrogenase (short-subunit alcohol dehydrogenase family)
LQNRGVYLITGGLGGIGLVVAEHLAREFNARLVLVSRSTIPQESQWKAALENDQTTATAKQTIRKLIEINAIAGGLLIAQADVTNLSQMRSVVSFMQPAFSMTALCY